jgi:hypothetical protein
MTEIMGCGIWLGICTLSGRHEAREAQARLGWTHTVCEMAGEGLEGKWNLCDKAPASTCASK